MSDQFAREQARLAEVRANEAYQYALINDQIRRDKFVGEFSPARFAAGAATGYALGWSLKQIWRSLWS